MSQLNGVNFANKLSKIFKLGTKNIFDVRACSMIDDYFPKVARKKIRRACKRLILLIDHYRNRVLS